MWALAIIEVQVSADRSAGLANTVVGPQIHLLIFDAATQPLDEDVIPPSSFAVHTDRDFVVGEHAGEGLAGDPYAKAWQRRIPVVEPFAVGGGLQATNELVSQRSLHGLSSGNRRSQGQHCIGCPSRSRGDRD